MEIYSQKVDLVQVEKLRKVEVLNHRIIPSLTGEDLTEVNPI